MKVAVSYISSNYSLPETIKLIDNSNADYIHVDLMDGKYVEDNNFDINETVELLSNTNKLLDVHLMTMNPEQYIIKLSKLNIDCINIHPKTTEYPEQLISIIKSLGFKVGIAINPDEEIKEFDYLFDDVDRILIMSVVPGKGGQEFLTDVISKIDKIIKLKDKYNYTVAVDGGINDKTIDNVKDVDIVISGSYICKSDDYNKAIDSLK